MAFAVFVATLGVVLLVGVTASSGSQRDVIVSYGGLALSALAAVGALVSILLKFSRYASETSPGRGGLRVRSAALVAISAVGLVSAVLATLLVWGALKTESPSPVSPVTPTAGGPQVSPGAPATTSAPPTTSPASSSDGPRVRPSTSSSTAESKEPSRRPTSTSEDTAPTGNSTPEVRMWADPSPASISNGGYVYFYLTGLSDPEHVRLEVVAPPGKGSFCSGVTSRCNLWLVMESFDFNKSTWGDLRVRGEDQFNIAMPLDGSTPTGSFTVHVDLVDRGTTLTSALVVNP